MKVEEFKKRRLRERYIVCYVIKKRMDMEIEGIIQEVNCVIVYGITMDNRRQWVGIYIEKDGDINFWYELLQSMKKRGLKSVGIFVIEKENKLEKGIRMAYCESKVIGLINSKIRNVCRYLLYSKNNRVQTQLMKMVEYKSRTEYENAMKEFKEKYVNKEILRDKFVECENTIKKYYEYEYEIRVILNQYYYIREIENKLNKIIKKYGSSIGKNDIIGEEIEYIEKTESVKAMKTVVFIEGISVMYERRDISGIEIKI